MYPLNTRIYGVFMSANIHYHLTTTRTYRLNPLQAHELHQTARRLGITESLLVRTLLKKGIDQLWGNNER
jgi:hypothetical protein